MLLQVSDQIQHTVIPIEMLGSVISTLLAFFGVFPAIGLHCFERQIQSFCGGVQVCRLNLKPVILEEHI